MKIKRNFKTLVILFIGMVVGSFIGSVFERSILIRIAKDERQMSKKHLNMFLLMNKWHDSYIKGKSISEYLIINEIRRIAVYGMSYIGETLVKELSDTDVDVVYGIDQKIEGNVCGIPVYKVENELPKVDAVIVTSISAMDEIEGKLSKKMNCEIYSLEEIIYMI